MTVRYNDGTIAKDGDEWAVITYYRSGNEDTMYYGTSLEKLEKLVSRLECNGYIFSVKTIASMRHPTTGE